MGEAMPTTKDFAEVIRAKMEADPALAEAVARERRRADIEAAIAGAGHPFSFDPFAVVWAAFMELYPDACVIVQWVDDLHNADGDPFGECFRSTIEDEPPLVSVDVRTPVSGAIEILAHELAHAVTPSDHEHGSQWRAAFDAINARYTEWALMLSGEDRGMGRAA